MSTKKITKQLPIKISEETVALRAQEHARVDIEIKTKKDDFRVESKKRAKELRDLQAESDRLAVVVNTKTELGEVSCEERPAFAENKVHTVRLDTGETVESRTMSNEERQLKTDEKGKK